MHIITIVNPRIYWLICQSTDDKVCSFNVRFLTIFHPYEPLKKLQIQWHVKIRTKTKFFHVYYFHPSRFRSSMFRNPEKKTNEWIFTTSDFSLRWSFFTSFPMTRTSLLIHSLVWVAGEFAFSKDIFIMFTQWYL